MSTLYTYPLPKSILQMDLHSHHVVEASAGTGKTFLIEHRVVDLIIRRGLELKDILLVTFTEKATAELKHRICSIISHVLAARFAPQPSSTHKSDQGVWAIDKDALERLQKSLDQSESAAISTIHGFCQKVISETTLHQGRATHRSVAPPWQLFRHAVEKCIEDTFSTDPALVPYLRAFLENAPMRFEPREELLSLLHQAAQFGGQLKPQFDKKALIRASEDLKKTIELKTPENWAIDSFKNGSVRKAATSRLNGLLNLLNDPQTGWPERLVKLPSLKCEYILGKSSESEDMLSLQSKLSLFLDHALSIQAILAQLFLPFVEERRQELKNNSGTHDFDDMIEKTHELFHAKSSADLGAHYAELYPCAFIDEFQDTDKLQWEIFKSIYITRGQQSSLTVVGDPKQSIYGFRGADLCTYFEAKQNILAHGGSELQLDVNFRSTPSLVNAINEILATDAPFFSGDVDYKHPVTPGLTATLINHEGEEVSPLGLLHADEQELKIGAIKEKLLYAIPNQIQRCLNKDTPLSVLEHGVKRDIQARNIMILTRTSAESHVLAKRCENQGIPVSVFQNEPLFLSKEASELRDLFYAIESPAHIKKRHRALLGRFCRCSSESLMAEDASPQYKLWTTQLLNWHKLLTERDLTKLIASIKTDSSFFVFEHFLDESRRSQINMNQLFELLLESASEGAVLFRGIGHWLQEHISKAKTPLGFDVPKERMGAELNAVQIMTFHKSKGLEADIVFLYGLFSSQKRKWVSNLIEDKKKETWLGELPQTKKKLHTAHQEAEDERLLYVAMTRAKSRLYLPFVSDSPKAITGAYSLLNDRLTPLTEGSSTVLLPIHFEDPSSVNTSTQKPTFQLNEHTGVPSTLRKKSWLSRASFQSLSYSKIKRQAPKPSRAFKDDFLNRSSQGVNPTLSRGAQVGIWLHKVIEHIDLNDVGRSPDAQAWISTSLNSNPAWQSNQAPNDEERNEWAKLLYQAFHTSLKTSAANLGFLHSFSHSNREVDFLYRSNRLADNQHVEGSIDFVFKKDQKLYLLDWKSDFLPEYEEDGNEINLKAITLEKYALQAQIYGDALTQMAEEPEVFEGCFYFYLRYSTFVYIAADELNALEREVATISIQPRNKS